jgi:hypothetical protein
MAQSEPTKLSPLIAYCVVAFCAVVLVVGGLAAFFEQAAIVRILGALAAVLALVVGNVIARCAWPKKPAPEV